MIELIISKLKSNKGFTLVEILVGIAVFSIIFLVLSSLFGVVFNTIRNNKARIGANSIALEQLEIARGMDFNEVKTDTGFTPPGVIQSEKTLTRSGTAFTIKTDIAFFDDAFDGLSPADSFPYDYKKVRVKVIWTNMANGSEEAVAMSTNVVPDGLEGLSPDKGGLLIKVFDASGIVIFGANVHIESVSEGYSVDALTDLNGNLWAPDLEPSDDYHITATKAGYSLDQTYPIDTNPASPAYNPNPTKPDAVVIADEVTALGFSIDVLGNLNIQTVNYNNPQNWKVNELQANSQTEVDLDIDGDDNIILIWLDDRQGGGNVDRIYAQKYKYNSGTGAFDKKWASDKELTASNNKKNPRTAVYGTNYFYAAWNNISSGNEEVYLEKFNSANGSSAWGPVKANSESGSADQIKSDLAADSAGNIYVVWMDDRNGNWDIYAQKHGPGGSALWASDLKINGDIGFSDQENPRVAVDNEDNFYVVWEDGINGDKDIFLAKFDGSGNTLFAGRKINTDSSGLDQYEPAVDFDGSEYLYISWSDKRNSQPDIYAQKIDKLGDIAASGDWTIGDVKINDDSMPDAWREKSAAAYFSDAAIYFSWEDDRNGNPDVYSAKFNSNGEKLWSYDLIMNGDSSSNPQGAPDTVTDSMGYAITAWEDDRDDQYDIYAARYKDLGFFLRTNVPVTVTGAKVKGTYPPDNPIYKYSKTFNSGASGSISIGDGTSVIEWDNYTLTVGAPWTKISTDQPEPLSINPGATETVIINVEP